MFRLLFITFNGTFRGTEEQRHHVHESPVAMTLPLIVLAILSIVGGFVGVPELFMHGGEKLSAFLAPVVRSKELHVEHSVEWILVGLTTGIAVVAILIAWSRYRNYKEEQTGAFGKVLENKWYVDELYHAAVVRPVKGLGNVLQTYFERLGIDWMVNGVGRLVQYGSRQMRWMQSGQVGSYVLLMVISMVLFFLFQFFIRK